MSNNKIFLSSPHMSDEGYEQQYVQEAFDTNWIAPLGANVNGFEKELCEIINVPAAAALVSGTSALHLALIMAGVGEGDTVFCQSLTFSATANPIIYQNATPVFIDSEYETWNMSPDALRRAFQQYPDTKAVLVVHLYGIPANLAEIATICQEHGAILIEDAAESLGSTYHGQHTGTFGNYGIYSFNGNKIITTSGGGMLVAKGDDAEGKISKARFYATQSREPARHYEHKEIGFNYRMSNIVAGIGRGQLKVLEHRVTQKQSIYHYYKEAFKGIPELEMMPFPENTNPNCWLSACTLTGDKVKPLDIIVALEADNIECRPIWKPMHLQPFFEKWDYVDNGGVAEDIFNRGICLPSDSKMTTEDLERVCTIIKGGFEGV